MNLLKSNNPAMQRVLTLCAGVARVPTTVLLLGESGTGKEILSRHIHDTSTRRNGPFVAINCAAIPASLIESEFFGHEKGSFSGANELKKGRFELASGGTLLLDEISELPFGLQSKLLRVLQERQFHRVGGIKNIECDVRIIATSNRNLAAMVQQKQFREDLYYRINVFPIQLPPLRARREDISDLSEVILRRLAHRLGRPTPSLTQPAFDFLSRYPFPGNVRELHNLLERAFILTDGNSIQVDSLVPDCIRSVRLEADESDPQAFDGLTLADVERRVILATLQKQSGNRTRTSEILGISIRTLRNRLREYRVAGFDIVEWRLGCAA